MIPPAPPHPGTPVLRGRALADGAVTSLWHAGWRFELSDGGTQDRVDAVTGIGLAMLQLTWWWRRR